jgi:hypothetical protein
MEREVSAGGSLSMIRRLVLLASITCACRASNPPIRAASTPTPKPITLDPADEPCVAQFAAYHEAHGKDLAPGCGWDGAEVRAWGHYAFAFGVTDARARGIRWLRDFALVRGARMHLGAAEQAALGAKVHDAAAADRTNFSNRTYVLSLRARQSKCVSVQALRAYEAAGRACVRPMEHAFEAYREGFVEGCMMNAPPSELAACKEAAEKSLSESTKP